MATELRGSHGPDRHHVLTGLFGTPDLHTLDVYRRHGGYEMLQRALGSLAPEQIHAEVKTSGLRGRGGAGFSTGTKWGFIPRDIPGPRYVVVNADESEPGTAKDRYLMENSPHMLLEGVCIACYAIGAHQAWIYIRGEYDGPYLRLADAIAELRGAGILGDRPFGCDYDLDIQMYRGHGAYICGEETGLLESLEGKRAQPRSRPPFPAVKGAWGRPTLLNNVETLANLPWIVRHGGAEYARFGLGTAKGTRLLTVSGDVRRPGVYEVEIGVSFRHVIMELAGGPPAGRLVGAGAARVHARHVDRPGRAGPHRHDRRLGRRDRDGRHALRRQGGVPAAPVLRQRVVRQVHALPRGRQLGRSDVRADPLGPGRPDGPPDSGPHPGEPSERPLPVRPGRLRGLGDHV